MKILLSPQQQRTLEHARTFDQQIQVKPMGAARDEVIKLLNTVADELRVQRFSECLPFLPERIRLELFIHFRKTFYEVFDCSEASSFDKGRIAMEIAEQLVEVHREVALEVSQKALVHLRHAAREALDDDCLDAYARSQYLLAKVFGVRGKINLAIRELKNVLLKAKGHDDASVHFQLGTLYAQRNQKKDRQSAEKHLRTAVQINPSHQNAIHALGQLYDDHGEREKAIAVLTELIGQIDPDEVSSGLCNEIGSLHYARFAEYKNRKEDLMARIMGPERHRLSESGNEYFTGLINARFELLLCFENPLRDKRLSVHQRRLQTLARIEELEQVITETMPDDVFLDQTEHGQLLRVFDELLQLIRDFRGQPSPLILAEQWYRKATQAPHLFPASLLNHASTLYFLGRHREALKVYEEAARMRVPESHYRIADLLLRSDRFQDFTRARRELDKYRSFHGGNKALGEKADELERLIERLETHR